MTNPKFSRAVLVPILVLAVNIGGELFAFVRHSPYGAWSMFLASEKAELHVSRLLPDGTSAPVNLLLYTHLFEPLWLNSYFDGRQIQPIVMALVGFIQSQVPGHYRAVLTSSENARPASTWTYER